MIIRKTKHRLWSGSAWSVYVGGDYIGHWRTPREAKHKGRMWYMWLTTGDFNYLYKNLDE